MKIPSSIFVRRILSAIRIHCVDSLTFSRQMCETTHIRVDDDAISHRLLRVASPPLRRLYAVLCPLLTSLTNCQPLGVHVMFSSNPAVFLYAYFLRWSLSYMQELDARNSIIFQATPFIAVGRIELRAEMLLCHSYL